MARSPGAKRKELDVGLCPGVAPIAREIRQISRRHDPTDDTSSRSPTGPDRAHQSAALFVSIHAEPCRAARRCPGATIYTLSDRASDAEAERLAEAENKADAPLAGLT